MDQYPATGSGTSSMDYNPSDPVNSFIETVRRIVTAPAGFFASLAPRGSVSPALIFAAICAFIYAVLENLVGLAFDRPVGRAVASIIFTPIFIIIGVFIGALILHLLVLIFIRPNSGFEATLRVVAYSSLTDLISWVPIIGGLLGFAAFVFLGIVGIRELHRTTTGTAALVVLIPTAILVAIVLFFLLLAALIGALVFFGR